VTHQTRNVRVRLRTWTGQPEADLSAWLGDAPHHYEGDQLVIHGEGADEDVRPRPGWQLVRWPDGVVTVASARTAARVYEPDAASTTPAELRDQVAAALYERERPPNDPAWPEAYPADREVFEAMADAVLPVVLPAARMPEPGIQPVLALDEPQEN
jgi:hypothetical protein